MDKFILDADGGIVTTVHAEDMRDPFAQGFFEYAQDVQPILDLNHSDRSLGHSVKDEYRLVARIPFVALLDAFREGWLFDDARMEKFLRDNPRFKCTDGNI